MEKTPLFDRCLVLAGCPPDEATVTPKEKRWMNWLVQRLIDEGYEAESPDMPTPWEPVYEEWKKVFEHYTVTENTILVGHSCGAAFLVRWLAETGKKVKKLILVAPAKVPEKEMDGRNAMYEFVIPTDTSKLAYEIVLFTSNDFPHHVKARQQYIDALQPRVIELENKGHFLYFQMGTNEFPELLQEVLS